MDTYDISDMIVEADFLWRETLVGDYVQVEDSIFEEGKELLSIGKEYMVLAKETSASGAQSFITETNMEGKIARVYPFYVCSYSRYQPIQHS